MRSELKRTISSRGKFGAVRNGIEPDTRQCTNKNVVLLRGMNCVI